MRIKQNSRKKLLRTRVVVVISLIVVFAFAYFLWLWLHTPSSTRTIETTSKEPSAQSSFSSGDKRDVVLKDKDEGFVTDTSGQSSSSSNQENWVSSASGVVIVQSPIKDMLLSNGESIVGQSSADRVSFRLIDDVSGVISQGSLAVVNGKFSGTFTFETSGREGRLDVFTVDTSGVESNVVEIPIRFK